MIKEFKEFIAKGSAIDIAVGVVIGAAFTAIVKALVDGVIMPLVGLVLGNVDFTNLFIVLKKGVPPRTLRDPQSRDGRRRSGDQLGRPRERDRDVLHRGIRHLPHDQGHQPRS